jgi:hypothetical protein
MTLRGMIHPLYCFYVLLQSNQSLTLKSQFHWMCTWHNFLQWRSRRRPFGKYSCSLIWCALVSLSVKQNFAIIWTSVLKIGSNTYVGFGIVNTFSFWKVGLHTVSQALIIIIIICLQYYMFSDASASGFIV